MGTRIVENASKTKRTKELGPIVRDDSERMYCLESTNVVFGEQTRGIVLKVHSPNNVTQSIIFGTRLRD